MKTTTITAIQKNTLKAAGYTVKRVYSSNQYAQRSKTRCKWQAFHEGHALPHLPERTAADAWWFALIYQRTGGQR